MDLQALHDKIEIRELLALGEGPVDRFLRLLLPPENTATGRRSLEYVRRMRRELGMPPPR